LERCLEALRRVDYPGITITIVDSAPNPDAAKALAGRYNVEYHLSTANGVSRARNIGARASRNDIVAYLDAQSDRLQSYPHSQTAGAVAARPTLMREMLPADEHTPTGQDPQKRREMP
jgi:hypothetical protein